MKTTAIVAKITQHDAQDFADLPQEVKEEVIEVLNICRIASTRDRPRKHLMAVAQHNKGRRGFSLKTLERKYYELCESQDWRCLVNRSKLTGNGNSQYVTPLVIEAWHGFCDQHKRSFKSAFIHMCQAYRAGRMVGDVDWRRVWHEEEQFCGQPMPRLCPPDMILPRGWSEGNLYRHKPRKIETAMARHGRHAARKFTARVRTTRVDLLPGQQYMIDDMWHNHKITCRNQLVRVLELAVIDIASAFKCAFGLKPRLADEAGKRTNLNTGDMRFLLAHLLCNVGYHRDGSQIIVEGGTAGVYSRLADKISELTGGVVEITTAGTDRVVDLGKWGYDTKGNPDAKAHIESSHNLYQNRLDHLPGYMGSNSRLNKPEDHDALCRIVGKQLAAATLLPEHLTRKLRFPVLDYETFSDIVHEVYHQIHESHDHMLEGWHERTERVWKAHPADMWHSEDEFHAMSPEEQAALAPIISRPGHHKDNFKLSRRQVWQRGQPDLVRLPDWTITMICDMDELGSFRPCPTGGEVIFVDQEIDNKPMIYKLSTCTAANGSKVQLIEGKEYLWLINPFDPGSIYITDTFGAYVGRCLRTDRIDRRNIAEIMKEAGRTRSELDTALAPYNTRQAKEQIRQIEATRSNIDILTEGILGRQTEAAVAAKISTERKERIKGKSVRDLVN